MTSSVHPFRTDRQKFKMAASVEENSKWSSGVMKFKMAPNDDELLNFLIFLMTSSPRTDKQKIKMAASVGENSK